MLQAANRTPTTVEAWTAERTTSRDPMLPFFIERYREAYAAEIDHFLAAVEERSSPEPSFADGIEALRLAEAASESLGSDHTVKIG